MHRRDFISGTIAAAALSAPTQASGSLAGQVTNSAVNAAGEFYQIRQYQLRSGPGVKVTDTYMTALIPALNRLGIAPVGAFKLEFGPETPSLTLLLPAKETELLATVEKRLAKDEEFQKIAAPFWSAPAAQPAFVRQESWLLSAFQGFPKLVLPKASATNGKRVFQLRTYESPSYAAHLRKVEMFHSGEFEIFRSSGIEQVFYGETLVGSHMPSLTYMLCFGDESEINPKWDNFFANAEWKKLAASPRFSSEAIVNNITNIILKPAPYSQI